MRIGSFRGRLILSVALVHTVMMTLFIADLVNRQQAMLIKQRMAVASALAQALASSGAVWLAANAGGGLQEVVETLRQYPDLQFAIITDGTGYILAHSDRALRGLFLTDLPDDGPLTVISNNEHLLDVAAPVMIGGHRVGWARIGIGRETVEARNAETMVIGFLYIGITIMVGSLIVGFLGSVVTRRLSSVQSTINLVRAGNQAMRSTITGRDEVALIATEFNALLDVLDERNAAVVRSEARFRSLIQDIQVAVVVHGSDTRIVMSNPMAQQLLGLSEEQLLGKAAIDPYWSFLREDGTAMPTDEYPVNWTMANRQALRDLIVGVHDSDKESVTWVMANTVPVMKEGEVIEQVIVTFVDITERKRVEKELRRMNERFSLATTAAHLGLWDWDIQKNELVWDDQMYSLYGVRREGFAGAYEAWLQGIHPDDRARSDEVSRAAQRGEGEYDTEFRVVWPDGSTHFLKAYGQVLRAADGTPLRMTGINFDITLQKESQDNLYDSQQLFQTLVENSPDIIARYNRDCQRIYVNPAFIAESRMSPGELLTTSPLQHSPMPAASARDLQDLLHRVVDKGKAEAIDVIWPKQGVDFWYNVSASPEFDREGRVASVMTISRDITARKRVEEEIKSVNEALEQRVAKRTTDLRQMSRELKENQFALMNIVEDLNDQTAELEKANAKLMDLDRLKSMFIASMSHELRTPLNSVIGYSSVLLNEWIGPLNAAQKEDLSAVLRSGKHLLSLINDVIDVSRIEAGKIDLLIEEVDVGAVVEEVVDTLRKDIEHKGLALSVQVPAQIILTDRRRFMQCILNLVSNAVKYTNQGSIDIATKLSTDGAKLILTVTDTGIGMRGEDLKKVYLPFVRFNEALQSNIPGTGLGLYLTKKMVQELLKGTILVSSTHGVGSTFSIHVPVSR